MSKHTPGPWVAEHTRDDLAGSPTLGPSRIRAGKEIVIEGYYSYENSGVHSPEDARYIALCSPENILALCELAEAALEKK